MDRLYTSIGLMSGTSMDGVDLSMIETDGKTVINRKHFSYKPYTKEMKAKLRSLIYGHPKLQEIKIIENEFTLFHAQFVNEFLTKNSIPHSKIDLISFHGHTVLHSPANGITWQIGNGHLLAVRTGISVVADFRTKDVVLRGQGAPLVPIYHFYMLNEVKHPVAILNIGGISNITYFDKKDGEDSIEAFDICFGNAPFDDLMQNKRGTDFDRNGELSKAGTVDVVFADRVLQHEIFHKKPPKSFDRDDFASLLSPISNLKIPDALATFSYIHAKALEINLNFLAQKPEEIFVCGGGRKNLAIMDDMKKYLYEIKIRPIEEIGLNGDSIESEAFAFLGVRCILNLPISFQKTTGISPENNFSQVSPQKHFSSCGGVVYLA